VGVAVIVLLTWLNCRGRHAEGSLIQNVFGLAKTLGLMVLIFAGLFRSAHAGRDCRRSQSDALGRASSTTPRFADVKKLVNLPPGIVALMVAGGAMVGALFSRMLGTM
jgi:amino acid transporter